MSKRGLWIGLYLVINACSVKPENAGQCRLDCGKAIISSNDTPVKLKLQTSVGDYACPASRANTSINNPPINVQFLLYEEFDTGSAELGKRPIPNISFDPIVTGLASPDPNDSPSLEFGARYAGIITPRDNWCSDSCGVMSLDVAGFCPDQGQAGGLDIQLHSGAIYSDLAEFNISTADP